MGTAAACSKVRLAGLGTTRSAAAHAYSANAPRKKPSTSSPVAQPAHVRADRLHHARRVDPGHPGLRLGQPHAHEPRDERVPSQDVPVGRVERGGVHPDQHVVGPDLWQVGVRQPQDLRRAEPAPGR